jgi:hypothetical protein
MKNILLTIDEDVLRRKYADERGTTLEALIAYWPSSRTIPVGD